MKKILVVEDEFYARKSIVKILQKSELPIAACEEAENGQDAVKILEEQKDLDLVITDICMNVMDGLELAEYIHKNRPDLPVILLTAFERFEYAKRALLYQVRDYLIKPIHSKNLIPAVEKVLLEQEQKLKETEDIRTSFRMEVEMEYVSMKTVMEHRDLFQRFFPLNEEQVKYYRVVVLQIEAECPRGTIDQINQAVRKCYDHGEARWFFSRINNELIILVTSENEEDLNLAEYRKREWQLVEYIHVCLNLEVTLGAGRVYREECDIYRSYKEAIYAMNQRLISGWNRTYYCSDMKKPESYPQNADMRRLEEELKAGREQEIIRIIHGIIWNVVEPEGNVQLLYQTVVEVLKRLSLCYADIGTEDRKRISDLDIMFSRRYDLYGFKHIYELEIDLNDIVKTICRPGAVVEKNRNILEIESYIEKNYYRDISLKEIAEKKYFMNYSYLSRLFRQETGKSFSRYLIEFRLNKARELLEQEDTKVSHVAYEVGYNDVSHFIQSFKKEYGMTPEEYRNQHMNEWRNNE